MEKNVDYMVLKLKGRLASMNTRTQNLKSPGAKNKTIRLLRRYKLMQSQGGF